MDRQQKIGQKLYVMEYLERRKNILRHKWKEVFQHFVIWKEKRQWEVLLLFSARLDGAKKSNLGGSTLAFFYMQCKSAANCGVLLSLSWGGMRLTLWDLLPRKVPKHKDSHVKHGAICGERETTHLTPKRQARRSNRLGNATKPQKWGFFRPRSFCWACIFC